MSPAEFDTDDVNIPNKTVIQHDCHSLLYLLIEEHIKRISICISRQSFWQLYVSILGSCQHLAIMRKLLQSSWGTLNGSINRGQPLRRSVTSKRANCKGKPILSHRTFHSLDQIVSKNKKSIFRRSCKQFTEQKRNEKFLVTYSNDAETQFSVC